MIKKRVSTLEKLMKNIRSIVKKENLKSLSHLYVRLSWKVNKCPETFSCKDQSFTVEVASLDEFWAEIKALAEFKIPKSLAQQLQSNNMLEWDSTCYEENTYTYEILIENS